MGPSGRAEGSLAYKGTDAASSQRPFSTEGLSYRGGVNAMHAAGGDAWRSGTQAQVRRSCPRTGSVRLRRQLEAVRHGARRDGFGGAGLAGKSASGGEGALTGALIERRLAANDPHEMGSLSSIRSRHRSSLSSLAPQLSQTLVDVATR